MCVCQMRRRRSVRWGEVGYESSASPRRRRRRRPTDDDPIPAASYHFSSGGVTLHLLHLFAPDAACRTFLSQKYTATQFPSVQTPPRTFLISPPPLFPYGHASLPPLLFPASRGHELIDRTSAAAKRLKKRRGGREGGRTQTNFRYISKRKYC